MDAAPPFQPFDTWQTPLEPGISLIEASAGTGKTHAIVALVLRLILEQRIPVEQILVVTYTEAATAELRGRLRKALLEASNCLAGKTMAEDSAWNLPSHLKRKPGALELAENAAKSLDLVQVRTIHGFCASVLNENAFETGSLFDSELLPSDVALVREIMEDFWRLHVSTATTLFASALRSQDCSVEQLVALGKALRTAPEAELETEHVEVAALQTELATLESVFARVSTICRAEGAVIRESIHKFATSHQLNKGCRPEELLACQVEIEEALTIGRDESALASMTSLAQSCLRAGVDKRQKRIDYPTHEFFTLCDDLKSAVERSRDALYRDAKSYFEREMEDRRSSQGIRGYSDLLIELAARLKSSGSELLRATLLAKYKAVLIDEYQDTDPLQYEIFHSVFAESPEHPLFLIGDPKQSIFGFRGADIHTYLRTNRAAKRRFTLTENHRSDPSMIETVNWLYTSADSPFGHEAIEFHRIRPAGKVTADFHQNGTPLPSLLVGVLNRTEIDKYAAARLFPRWAAARAAEILRSDFRLGEKKVRPGDIAILSRRNSDALLIQENLRELGIPAILQKSGNLFDSIEAIELERVLSALVEPHKLSLTRGALVTPIFDWNLDDIAASGQSSHRWQAQLEEFAEAARIWRGEGFAAMFKHLLITGAAMERMLRLPGGERKVVNYLHLLECIEEAAREEQLNPEGVLEWLRNRRLDSTSGMREEYELRLESDEAAVKLVTIHKCKGMQYPIVIAADLWRPGFFGSKNGVAMATEEGRKKIYVSKQIPRRFKDLMRQETLEEDARILYVALTRAVHHCSILWYAEERDPSALLRILPLEKVTALLSGSVEGAEARDVRGIGEPSSVAEDSESRFGTGPLAPRLAPIIHPSASWSIYSFSSFKAQLEKSNPADEVDLPDLAADETQLETVVIEDAEAPPNGGTRLGAMLHVIYERHRFDRPAELGEIVKEAMTQYGYLPKYSGWVEARVRASLDTPLVDGAPLSAIPNEAMRKELEFHFPTKRSKAADLQAIIRADTDRQPVPSSRRGFLKGFIDLIFRWHDRYYILDWKSNFLGSEASAWTPGALDRVMRHSYYDLQYHLYTAALSRLLKLRLPNYHYEKHFGGVFYLFVRGMNPNDPSHGVVHERPSAETLAKFEAEFSSEPETP